MEIIKFEMILNEKLDAVYLKKNIFSKMNDYLD